MDIKTSIEITITTEELVKIVNNYLSKERHMYVKGHTLNLRDVSDERDRYSSYTLDSIKFQVEPITEL